MKVFVLIVFIVVYLLIIALPKFKAYFSGAGALILIVGGALSVGNAFSVIDYNVVFMLLGIMLTVGFFSDSEMPNLLAEKIVSKLPNALTAVTVLCILSGVISAFIDNVATVFMLAPIGIAVARRLNIPLIPVIVGIAVSSNLQGAATLVGDTTSIMLGSFADMSFFEFFFLNGKFSIFWAVELGALATIPIIILIFRKHNKKLLYETKEIKVKTIVPTILLLANILSLIVVSFFSIDFPYTNGLICLGFGIISLVYYVIREKAQALKIAVKNIDFDTVLFITFLFVIIGAITNVGIIDDISGLFISIGSENVFLLYTVIVYGSMLCSAFIDNIPFVATMLPVISGVIKGMPVSPYLLYFGLLIGATLGGNLTPVGASANVVGTGILRKEGENVKFKDFAKIGIPFTLTAVTVGYLFIWLIWS